VCNLAGRYVSVRRATIDYLSICELQAFGPVQPSPPPNPPPSPPPPVWLVNVPLAVSGVTCQSGSPLTATSFNVNSACPDILGTGATAQGWNPSSAKPYVVTFSFAQRVYINSFNMLTLGDTTHDFNSISLACGTTSSYTGVAGASNQTFAFANPLPVAGCTSAVLTIASTHSIYQAYVLKVSFTGLLAGAPPPNPPPSPPPSPPQPPQPPPSPPFPSALVVAAQACANPSAYQLQNGGFELPSLGANTFAMWSDASGLGTGASYPASSAVVPGWYTTSTNRLLELWYTSRVYSVPSDTGVQHAELAASVSGTLYQDISTVPGQLLLYSFAHRGRDGADVMRVDIGPPSNGSSGVTTSLGLFSDGTSAWRRYSGNYTVPYGQTTTRISFVTTSVTYTNVATISAGCASSACGNLLDSMQLSMPALACDDAASTRYGVAVSVPVAANDVGASLTVVAAGGAARGTAAVVSGTNVTYTPAAGTCGDDAVTYTVRDAYGFNATGTLTVSVQCPPPPPPSPPPSPSPPSPPPPLTGYLPSACFGPKAVACFEASAFSGATWSDLSGNGNHLSMTGTFNQSAVYSVPSGVYFGGNTFAYRATYAPSLAVDYTVMLWLYATTGEHRVGRGVLRHAWSC
jgi:hypothetical protein